MNFIFLSPHFPANYYRFCVALQAAGARVLGIGDMAYDNMRSELKGALTEYYRVEDLHNFAAVKAACEYFSQKYGKIHRIESHNEYWLETDARLRTELNVEGLKLSQIESMKAKSRMKEIFQKAEIAVPSGQIVSTIEAALGFIEQVGYPVIVKPDKGVGAEATYRINGREELEGFFAKGLSRRYLMEEYIVGQIQTFDGLVDREGQVVFYTSHVYSHGIMEFISQGLDVAFYAVRRIPSELEEAGRRVLAAFALRERFFHLEFFRRQRDGQLVALEVNMRPPGGPILDMFNFANDINMYQEWANMIRTGHFNTGVYNATLRKYFCGYAGRRQYHRYKLSHEQILEAYGKYIVAHEPLPALYSKAMGDYCYLIRSTEQDDIHTVTQAIFQQ